MKKRIFVTATSYATWRLINGSVRHKEMARLVTDNVCDAAPGADALIMQTNHTVDQYRGPICGKISKHHSLDVVAPRPSSSDAGAVPLGAAPANPYECEY